jgi:hypothetical protein
MAVRRTPNATIGKNCIRRYWPTRKKSTSSTSSPVATLIKVA